WFTSARAKANSTTGDAITEAAGLVAYLLALAQHRELRFDAPHGIGSNPDLVASRLGNKLHLLIVERQIARSDRKGYSLSFARLERNAAESFQQPNWLRDTDGHLADIELNHLNSREPASVGDISRDSEDASFA